MTLTVQRRFVTPEADETLEALAARSLPDLPLEEAMDMTASELTSSVTEIKTEALVKIQADLMNKAAYSARYADAEAWSETALGTVRGPGSKTRSVPAL